jgi:hypothetical protein
MPMTPSVAPGGGATGCVTAVPLCYLIPLSAEVPADLPGVREWITSEKGGMMSMPIGIYNFMRRQPIMRLFTLSGLLVAVACIRVFSAEGTNAAAPSQLDIFTMGMGLVGGLALFLFGMEQLADALKARAGDSLKDVLARLTTNRVTGALTGAFVTACVQSSSVTTVLVVGFITANIMSLSQSVSVIFGANIGSTVTA